MKAVRGCAGEGQTGPGMISAPLETEQARPAGQWPFPCGDREGQRGESVALAAVGSAPRCWRRAPLPAGMTPSSCAVASPGPAAGAGPERGGTWPCAGAAQSPAGQAEARQTGSLAGRGPPRTHGRPGAGRDTEAGESGREPMWSQSRPDRLPLTPFQALPMRWAQLA